LSRVRRGCHACTLGEKGGLKLKGRGKEIHFDPARSEPNTKRYPNKV
jgi:hypothetical protein